MSVIFVSGRGVRSCLDKFGLGRGWYKNARGSMGLDKMHFCNYFSYSEGQGRGLRDWMKWRERERERERERRMNDICVL